MFRVDETTKKITLHRGDTGTVTYRFTGYTFGADDRILWTMKSENGTIVKEHLLAPEDNEVTVEFKNADTDQLAPGMYKYDVRIIVDPEYDESDPPRVIDTDEGFVNTPESPLYVELLATVGQI